MTNLGTKALEKSTYVITAAFTDEAGTAVTPNSIVWKLTDSSGNTINSRTGTTIAVPAASNNIVLSGDDLAIPIPDRLGRILTIIAEYDSSMGINLPLNDEITFEVLPLTNV